MTYANVRVLLCSRTDDEAADLRGRLAARDWAVIECGLGAEAMRVARDEHPDLAIAVSNNGANSGVALAESLKRVPETAHIPVVVMCATTGAHVQRACLAAGVDDLLAVPIEEGILLPRLAPLIRLSTMHGELRNRIATARSFDVDVPDRPDGVIATTPPVVLVVGDVAETRDRVAGELGGEIEVNLLDDPYAAGDALNAREYDALVLVPGRNPEGFVYLCAHVRNNPRLFNLPVLMVMREGLSTDAETLYGRGASIVLPDPPPREEMWASLLTLVRRQRTRRALRDILAATREAATTSAGTGLYNRAFAAAHLNRLLEAAKRRQKPLSIVLFNVENRAWADARLSSGAGAHLMNQVASWVSGLIRAEDLAVHWDDDEILVILPDANREEAAIVCHRISGVLQNTDFGLERDGEKVAIKVWLEAAWAEIEPGDSVGSFIERARESLV